MSIESIVTVGKHAAEKNKASKMILNCVGIFVEGILKDRLDF